MRLSSHVPLRGQAASFNTRCPKKQEPILAVRVPFKRLGFDALGAWDVAWLLVTDMHEAPDSIPSTAEKNRPGSTDL